MNYENLKEEILDIIENPDGRNLEYINKLTKISSDFRKEYINVFQEMRNKHCFKNSSEFVHYVIGFVAMISGSEIQALNSANFGDVEQLIEYHLELMTRSIAVREFSDKNPELFRTH